jgi:hypothetical protein
MRCPSYTWHTAQFYDNEVSFLYLTLSPHSYDIEVSFLYLTLSPSLMTMKCHSYTWHSSHSYDNEVSFLYLTLIPVLCQWGVLPILDTQPSFMTMKCHSYTWHSAPILMTLRCPSCTWHSAQSYDNEVSFLYDMRLGWVSSIGMTPHCHENGLCVKYRKDTSLT